MTAFARGEERATALVQASDGRSLTYAELDRATREFARTLGTVPELVFHFADNSLESAVAFLGARSAGHAVALLDPQLRQSLADRLLDLYEPQHVTGTSSLENSAYVQERPRHWVRVKPTRVRPHPGLGVLLSTSGSTGSPKFVRLSGHAVESNATAIAASLSLTPSERAFASLPLHYSYGMSVLTSHLAAGATTILTTSSVIEPDYWTQFARHEATSLSGVPYTYQMLDRIGFLDRDLPTLRSMTQAGGRLAPALSAKFHAALSSRGCRFFTMYGQTEAAPRMSCLSPDEATRKVGSVGLPLAGGSFRIDDTEGRPAPVDVEGEVVYTGPNVMWGYATQPDDLAVGDELGGELRTGDLGRLDADGYLFITGRTKRIGKVFGVRISLDEVEGMIGSLGRVAALERENGLRIFHEATDGARVMAVRKRLASELRIPSKALEFRQMDGLPVLSNGKPNYEALRREV